MHQLNTASLEGVSCLFVSFVNEQFCFASKSSRDISHSCAI